jgi:CubicO group peptidase (beta-lactamase class C family)
LRFLFFLFVFFASSVHSAPDEETLGKAEGYPKCGALDSAKLPQRCLVGLYSHYDEVVPFHRVAKAAAPRPLKRAAQPGDAYDFGAYLAANRDTGLLVLKGDTILFEGYQYERRPEDRFTSMSMAKTVMAMLFGIALSEGKIRSIDDRAEQYVPALKGHPYGETPLRHLLTMSSGVKFREDYEGNDDVSTLAFATVYGWGAGGPAAVRSFNQRIRPPGDTFYYASAESEVLGLVLRAAVGKPLAEYLQEKIWQPMGAEADATWLVDAGDYELGFAGIQATLRDWGRFGLLLAEGGARDGRQIIPAEWVKAATRPDDSHLAPGTATRYLGYGYQIWLVPGARPTFALLGVRGQAVFVDPAAKLVVVHTAVFAQARGSRDNQFSLWNALLRSYSF